MFKKYAIAALAAISVGAFAQSMWQPGDDPASMNYQDQRKMVMHWADKTMMAGDSYQLIQTIDSAPANISMVLADSLSKNNFQSRIIGHEIALSRIPAEVTSYSTTVTNPDGTVTTTTTTTTDYTTTYAENMRPMRMVMEKPMPRNIGYDDAINILCSNLGQSEATSLRIWWWNTSTEQDKDAIVRFLRGNSEFADDIIYPSTVMHIR